MVNLKIVPGAHFGKIGNANFGTRCTVPCYILLQNYPAAITWQNDRPLFWKAPQARASECVGVPQIAFVF